MTTVWFVVLAVLWVGFLILEGFDFGVGVLQRFLANDDEGRDILIGTIAPVWDGNEVWLITAGAATFAAFPDWYATMFSGFYLAMVLLLLALILRGVAIEFRGKRDSARWRAGWTNALAGTSAVAPLVIGIALANLLYGVPIDADKEYVGTLADLFNAYAILAGLTVVALTLLHGALFLAMKVGGDLHERATHAARWLAPVAVAAAAGFVVWTHVLARPGVGPSLVELATVLAVIAAAGLAWRGRAGWAFAASAVTVAGLVTTLFANLYPRVMVSSLGDAFDLTIHNASSAPYSLKVMTVVVAIFLPGVLIYQGWTYHVFRQRVFRPSSRE